MHSQNSELLARSQTLPNRKPLRFDMAQMQQRFDKEPFLIGHDLTDHPLFELPRLIELSMTLPLESVEYNSGNLPIGQDPTSTPRTGFSVEETVRQIEHCSSWMVLKDVEQDQRYKQLLDDCLDQIEPAIDAVSPGMVARKAFVFISSPGAVTPYHVDFEYNFLLQIRGAKVMTVFNGQDRSLLSEVDRERAVAGGPRNLEYHEEYAAKGRTFDLVPGVGLHVPLTSPHWVKVADNVSISFSITFHSKMSRRTIGAHKTNALLREFHMSPRRVGESDAIDTIKFTAHRVIGKLAAAKSRFGGQN